MTSEQTPSSSCTPVDSQRVDQICDRFEADWLAGRHPVLEDYLAEVNVGLRAALLHELLAAEWDLRVSAREPVELQHYLDRFPDQAALVAAAHHQWFAESAEEATGSPIVPQLFGPNAGTGGGVQPDLRIPGYEILEVLGRGGMGVVYRARDVKLKRDVALKMVLSGRSASRSERTRFFSEAEAVASLTHPNIVQVYEVSQHDDCPFMVLEFVAGGTLAARVAEAPLSAREAAVLVEAVARGMNVAHQSGLVHRDVKPANILIDDAGQPKLTDFGLVKQLEEESGLTLSGTPIGTPSYMAPEQAAGQSHRVGPAADVYSLGATLYACLTGVPPHQADSTMETLRRVVEEEPTPLRQVCTAVPRDLETICLKALHKDPLRRYPSAAAFAEDLACWLDHRPITARPTTGAEYVAKWCQRRPAVAALLAVSVLAVITMISGAIFFTAKLRTERDSAIAAGNKADVEKVRAEEQSRRAAQREAEALSEARKAAAAADFLVGMFEDADLFGLSGRTFGVLPSLNPTGRQILDRGRTKLFERGAFRDDPLLKATLMHNLGRSYLSLGDTDSARPLLRESLELREKLLARHHPDFAASMHENALLDCFDFDVEIGARASRKAWELRRAIHGDDHPLTLESEFQLGVLSLYASGRTAREQKILRAAASHLRHVCEMRGKLLADAEAVRPGDVGIEVESLGAAVAFLATALLMSGDYLQGLQSVGELRELARRIPDQEKAQLVMDLIDTQVFLFTGQQRQAEETCRRSIASIKKLLGDDHYLLIIVLSPLAGFCYDRGHFEEAEDLGRERLGLIRRYFPNDQVNLANCKYVVARAMWRGRVREARESGGDQEQYKRLFMQVEQLAREAADVEQSGISKHSGRHENFLAAVLLEKEPMRLEEPTILFRRAWESRCQVKGYDHELSTYSLARLLSMLARQGRIEELQGHWHVHQAKLTEGQLWIESGLSYLVEAAAKLAVHDEFDIALQLLYLAAERGYDISSLTGDSTFAWLGERSEFEELVAIVPLSEPMDRRGGLLDGLKSLLGQ